MNISDNRTETLFNKYTESSHKSAQKHLIIDRRHRHTPIPTPLKLEFAIFRRRIYIGDDKTARGRSGLGLTQVVRGLSDRPASR